MSCSGDGTTLVDRDDDPHPSSALGRFILETLIAEGVTGRIYRAQDAAVRVLFGDFGTQELVVKRLFREVAAAKELQHPNVARLLDAGTDDGTTWIASELASGQTLAAMMAGPALDLDRVGSICAQIAAALAEAHDADLVHKNLSPTNVMVGPKGRRDVVKVLDFGLGSLARSSQAVRLRTGRDYAAPEATRSSGASKAGDVFALGSIAAELIGKTPCGETGLAALIAAMIDPDPTGRPQSGRDVLARLDDLGYSPIALAPSKPQPQPSVTPDLRRALSTDGLVLVEPPSPSGQVEIPVTTTYVYARDHRVDNEATTRDDIDILASQQKLGLLERAVPDRPRARPHLDPAEQRLQAPLTGDSDQRGHRGGAGAAARCRAGGPRRGGAVRGGGAGDLLA